MAIKNFIEKVSYYEGRGGRLDYTMHINDARLLRDELTKLLADYYSLSKSKEVAEEVIKVEINGGKF